MKKLSIDIIDKLSSRKGVRKIAVENFLISVHNNSTIYDAQMNLRQDSKIYGWNKETIKAIRDGIKLSNNDGTTKKT